MNAKNMKTILIMVNETICCIAIIDIEDEAEYWMVVKTHTKNKSELIAAEKICSLFSPVTKQLKYSKFFKSIFSYFIIKIFIY